MAKATEKETIMAETADAPVSAPETAGKAPAKAAAKTGTAYTIPELAANAKKIFGTRPECVTAALRSVGGTKAFTVTEAKGIVSKFLSKEVR